jgi:trk system potassium uptake protein TrkA
MFILIVGGGKVGTYLARALIRQQHEVVVIEKETRKAQMLTNLLEADVAVVGDGCDPNVLLQAGVARADVVVADTGDDEDNLVVVLITKKHSGARCIARVNNPKNKLIFESLDSEQPVTVVSSTEIILDIIEDRVNATTLETLARLGKGDLELVQLAITNESPARGRRIADLELPAA